MILLALAAAAQNPNGTSYGAALIACARHAASKFDDRATDPAIVAHRSVASCTSEIAAIRGALRTIVSRYVNPDTPEGKEAVAAHTEIITGKAEEELASEVKAVREDGR